MLTVIVHHLLHVFEDLGVAAVRLGGHAADVGLPIVKYARRLGMDDEGDGQQRLDPFWEMSVCMGEGCVTWPREFSVGVGVHGLLWDGILGSWCTRDCWEATEGVQRYTAGGLGCEGGGMSTPVGSTYELIPAMGLEGI